MEQDRFPGKIWVVSHKPVAVAAGLGHMGIHRNVIHPKFGNFIVLGTVLIDAQTTATLSTTTPAWSASCAWRSVTYLVPPNTAQPKYFQKQSTSRKPISRSQWH